MSRGQLPKAYLRVDPNLDQTHPEPLAMLLLLCAANRQPVRGRFKTRSIVDHAIGSARVSRLIARGDLIQDGAGRWEVDKWDVWQEGDLTVGDRMRRLRERRTGVTSASLVRNTTVTEPVTDAVTKVLPPSEASRRLGVKALDALTSEVARDGEPEWEVLLWLNEHGCNIRPGDGYHQRLIPAVERLGSNALIGMMDRLSRAGTPDGDIGGLLWKAIDALDSRNRPKLADLEAEERAEERGRSFDDRVKATRGKTGELAAMLAEQYAAEAKP